MRCECPEVTRCCFCLPLRLGLLVWAYIKTISCALLFCLSMFNLISDCVQRRCNISRGSTILYIFLPLTLTLVDIIFHIVFIISAHKKESRKMRIFYKYSIAICSLYLLGFIVSIVVMFTHKYFMLYAIFLGLFQIAVFMWIIVIQAYVLILVRSEVVKLERNSNFEFVNHAAEAEYTTKPDIKDQEKLGY